MLSKVTLEDVNDELSLILHNSAQYAEESLLEDRLTVAENIISTIASGDGEPWALCQLYMDRLYPGESAQIYLPKYVDKEYHSG